MNQHNAIKYPLSRVAAWFGDGNYIMQDDGTYTAVCPRCSDPTLWIYAKSPTVATISCTKCKEDEVLAALGKEPQDLIWFEAPVVAPQVTQTTPAAKPVTKDKWGRRIKERDPLPLIPERPEAIEWPETPLDKYIDALVERTQAPRELCAQSILAAATLSVQHIANISMPGIGGSSAERPISNYFLTIARSGERKSSADRIALEGLEEWRKELETIYSEQMAGYELEQVAWQQTYKRLSDEGRSADAGPEPQAPRTPMLLIKEPTQEGVFRSLKQGQLSQGLFNDEGGAFLGGYGMSKDNRMKTAATLNSLWDGSALDRIRAQEVEVLRGRRFCLHLMMQPHASEQLVGDAMLRDLGFTARCLASEPESTIGSRMFRESSEESLITCDLFKKQLLFNLRVKADTDDHGLAPRVIHLSREALDYWIEFYNIVESALGDKYRTIQGFAGKAPEHALRLAAVLTLFRLPTAKQIDVDAMCQGIYLTMYYLQQQLRLEVGRPSELDEAAERLLKWMRDKEYSIISLRDICQRGPSVLRKREKAEAAIDACVQAGWLVETGPGEVKGVRRKQTWTMVADEEKRSSVAATVAATVASERSMES